MKPQSSSPIRRAAALGIALLLASGVAAQTRESLLERGARLEAAVPAWLEAARVPGAALAIGDRDGVAWSHAFGLPNAESAEPAGPETLFGAASLTKIVVAYATLRLVAEEVLDLDRPLVEYGALADIAHDPRHERLTLRRVLSHTTGLPNWRPRGARLDFVADPGARYGYSGEGFVLLGQILEQVTGSRLTQLTGELVFEPLGMKRSYLARPDDVADLASPHDARGRPKGLPDRGVNAAASLFTTASDYARLLCALLRAEGLNEELARELVTTQVEISPGVGWGLGLGIEEQPGGPALWQWGHNDGYRAFATLHPASGTAFVYLANGDGGMLPLKRILSIATGEDEHPALGHMGYDSLDSPRYAVLRRLEQTLEQDGAEAVVASFPRLEEKHPPEAFDARLLDDVGYALLHADPPQVADAVRIFALNAERYPSNASAQASLGEGLRALGKPEEALAAYVRALALDPEHSGGQRALEELRAELAR